MRRHFYILMVLGLSLFAHPQTTYAQNPLTTSISTRLMVLFFGESEKQKKQREDEERNKKFFEMMKQYSEGNRNFETLAAERNKIMQEIVEIERKNKILEEKSKKLTEELKYVRMTIWDFYHDNIEYQDFNQIDFADIPSTEFNLPLKAKLPNLSYVETINEHDQILFNSYIKKTIDDKGLSDEAISKMNGKEIIELTRDIVSKNLNYLSTPEIKKSSSIRCMLMGVGNCVSYAFAFENIFNWLKEKNKSIRNIFVVRELGTNAELNSEHAWNTILIYKKDKLIVSEVDPTFHDNNGSFEATSDHVNSDTNLFLSNFYRDVGEFDVAYKYYLAYASDGNHFDEPIQEWVIHEMSEDAKKIGWSKYNDWVNNKVKELPSHNVEKK